MLQINIGQRDVSNKEQKKYKILEYRKDNLEQKI